jgi:hypothetical protein
MSPRTRERHLEDIDRPEPALPSSINSTTHDRVTRAFASASANIGSMNVNINERDRIPKGAYANDHLSNIRQRLFSALRQAPIGPQYTARASTASLSN